MRCLAHSAHSCGGLLTLRARRSQNVFRAHNMTGWGRDRNPMCPSGQATAENGAACDANNRAYVDASSHSWTGVTCNRAGNVRGPASAVLRV